MSSSNNKPALAGRLPLGLSGLVAILFALSLHSSATAQDATPPVAPSPAGESAAEGSEEGDPTLFGEEFQLNAVSIQFELAEAVNGKSEVTLLDAQQDVTLEMEQFTITGVRLTYSDKDKILRAYGDENQRCVVKQKDAISRCDQFIYSTETGETTFRGRPEIEFSEGEDSNLMRADNIAIERDEKTKRTFVRLRSNAMLGTRTMIERQIENPKTNNPTIVVGGEGTGRAPGAPALVLDPALAPPAPVVAITEKNAADVTDATEKDLAKIKAERPFRDKKADGGGIKIGGGDKK
jgi:hypothetical protein